MIDIENVVFNRIATTLRTEFLSDYPDLKVYGEYVEFPESFPCVSTWMTDNYTHTQTLELANTDEHHANVMFTTEVYTVGQDRKALAKKLANRVDELFLGMGLARNAMLALPNADPNAYRITLRHTGIASAFKSYGDAPDTLITTIYR